MILHTSCSLGMSFGSSKGMRPDRYLGTKRLESGFSSIKSDLVVGVVRQMDGVSC